MPILKVQLDTTPYDQVVMTEFLKQATEGFAAVLEAPTDRIRVFINHVEPTQAVANGGLAADNGGVPPFFEFYLLAGRPPEHKTQLITVFTDVIEQVLGVPRDVIRGCCHHIDPTDWGIAGVPAAAKRADEIKARADQAK